MIEPLSPGGHSAEVQQVAVLQEPCKDSCSIGIKLLARRSCSSWTRAVLIDPQVEAAGAAICGAEYKRVAAGDAAASDCTAAQETASREV